MKIDFYKYISITAKISFLFFSLIQFKLDLVNAEQPALKEIEIDSTTKFDKNSSDILTNPFELVEMIRRANSMNDATLPSKSIDDALNIFNNIEVEEDL